MKQMKSNEINDKPC